MTISPDLSPVVTLDTSVSNIHLVSSNPNDMTLFDPNPQTVTLTATSVEYPSLIAPDTATFTVQLVNPCDSALITIDQIPSQTLLIFESDYA